MKTNWDGFALPKRKPLDLEYSQEAKRNNDARREIEALRDRKQLANELGVTLKELEEMGL